MCMYYAGCVCTALLCCPRRAPCKIAPLQRFYPFVIYKTHSFTVCVSDRIGLVLVAGTGRKVGGSNTHGRENIIT